MNKRVHICCALSKQLANSLTKISVTDTFKLLLITAILISSQPMMAQKIAGEWNGVIQQDAGGLSDQYYFSMHLIRKGEQITGFTKVELYKNKKRILYARKRIVGTFKNQILKFKEVEVVEEEIYTVSSICLINAKLKFGWDKGSMCFMGTWGGYTTDGTTCSPGTIKVCSQIPVAHIQ